MAGFRAYFDFSQNSRIEIGDEIALSPDESRHLCGSLRANSGDLVDAFDLSGNVKRCQIISDNPKHTTLKILQNIEIPTRQVEIFIAQCMPKGKTFDDIIRQSVEIGAAGVIPLLSEHSQVKIPDSEKSKKLEKWEIRVAEAVKQSANFFSFDIPTPESLDKFLQNSAKNFDLKIVASLEDGALPISEVLKRNQTAKKICALIGPEGDLSANEYAYARSAGFLPVTLGKNVMKCDTAAIFTLSAIISQLGA